MLKRKTNHKIFSILFWRIAAVTSIFLLSISILIFIQIDASLKELRDRSLEDYAYDIAGYIEKSEDGALYLDLPVSVRKFYAEAGKYRQYVVRDEQGQILFTSSIAFSDRYPTFVQNKNDIFGFFGPYGTYFLGTGIKYVFDDKTYIVQVAQSEELAESFSDEITWDFIEGIFYLALPLFGLVMAVIYISLKQSLKPLSVASQQARGITFQNPEVRIDENDLPDEIKSLVRAINYALERLEKGIKAQQEFTSNVSHELRTPLSLLKSRIELIPDAKLSKTLEDDVEDMIRLVNQMLDLSRLDFPEAVNMGDVNLSKIIKTISQDMWHLFVQDGRELSVTGIEIPQIVQGNKDLIYRAVRNILDNALNYSPSGSAVEITIKDYCIYIRDHGNTIAAKEREKIFTRFHRSDRQKMKYGAGIGLSIVSRTMDIHGGRVLHDVPANGEGNIFKLEFPKPE